MEEAKLLVKLVALRRVRGGWARLLWVGAYAAVAVVVATDMMDSQVGSIWVFKARQIQKIIGRGCSRTGCRPVMRPLDCAPDGSFTGLGSLLGGAGKTRFQVVVVLIPERPTRRPQGKVS